LSQASRSRTETPIVQTSSSPWQRLGGWRMGS
jgi:hypothetical protein